MTTASNHAYKRLTDAEQDEIAEALMDALRAESDPADLAALEAGFAAAKERDRQSRKYATGGIVKTPPIPASGCCQDVL